jgi:hypothetical protein
VSLLSNGSSPHGGLSGKVPGDYRGVSGVEQFDLPDSGAAEALLVTSQISPAAIWSGLNVRSRSCALSRARML